MFSQLVSCTYFKQSSSASCMAPCLAIPFAALGCLGRVVFADVGVEAADLLEVARAAVALVGIPRVGVHPPHVGPQVA